MTATARLLGRVEVSGTAVSGVKTKALLTTLLLQANRTVTTGRLMRALWEQETPRSAVANLRTYAHQLRQALSLQDIALHGQSSGYALSIAAERCDHLSFAQLANEGCQALAEGEPQLAVNTLHQALRLWRGNFAAEGVPRYGPLFGWLGDLDTERQRAIEALAEAHLALGQPRESVRELTNLLEVAPLRGKAWQLRMLAHHQLGENDAVGFAYREASRLFREELGVDPDPELTHLYQKLLQSGASLGPQPHAVTPTVYLPAAPANLVGRERALAAISRAVCDQHLCRRPRVVIVEGPPGVGSSAVVLQAAHQLVHEFRDGLYYLDAKDFSTTEGGGGPQTLLQMLGVAHPPASPANSAAMLQRATADRRVLVVVDNVAEARQVDSLLCAGPRCCLLIASRYPLGTIHADQRLHLSPLTDKQSIMVLGRLLRGTHAEGDALADLAAACEGLPLALHIAAARLVDHPGLPIAALTARLRDDCRALDELEMTGLSLRASLLRCLDGLPSEAIQAYPRVAAIGSFTTAIAARLLNLPEVATERMLDTLARAHLVTTVGFGRYRVPRFACLLALEMEPQCAPSAPAANHRTEGAPSYFFAQIEQQPA